MDNMTKVCWSIIGILLAVFTVPLYHWLLGEFSVLVAIPLGLLIGRIIYRHTAFGGSGEERKRRSVRNPRDRIRPKGRIYIDKYGHIFDPQDEDF